MTVMQQGGAVPEAGGGSGNLYDVLELVLDRGLVIDAFVRVSLVGIEIAKIDARIVVASVDTYLRFAEACNRLDLESGRKAPAQLSEVMEKSVEGGAKGKSKGALTGAVEAFTDAVSGEREEEPERRPRQSKERRSQEKAHHERSGARRSSEDGD